MAEPTGEIRLPTAAFYFEPSTSKLWVWTGTEYMWFNLITGDTGITDANNGLTNNEGVVQLGGQLNQLTTINLNGNQFEITGLGIDMQFNDYDLFTTVQGTGTGNYMTFELAANDGDNQTIRLMAQRGNLGSGIFNSTVSASSGNTMIVGLTGLGGGVKSVNIYFDFASGIIITDSQNQAGQSYGGDYSTNGIDSFGDRWIPDWGAVNTLLLAFVPIGGNTSNPMTGDLLLGNNIISGTQGIGWTVGQNPRFGYFYFESDPGGPASTIYFNRGDGTEKTLRYNPNFYSDQRLRWGTDQLAYLSDLGGGGPPTGTAGGDLSGTYPNPSVNQVNGVTKLYYDPTSSIQTQLNGKQSTGNYITALTGDVTAAGPGSSATTLATVNANTGSFGTASSVPTIALNGKGLATAAANTPIQISESQVTNLTTDLTSLQTQLTTLKNSLSYPIRAGVAGDSRAHIDSGTNNDVNLISATNGNNGTSLIPGRIGGHLSLVSIGKILPIADGGIGGQTSTQFLARDTAAFSVSRKALTDMANLGVQVLFLYSGINDLLAIRTTTTGPQITTIQNTLLANQTTTLQRCIELGMIPVVISAEGNTYGSQAISAGYTAADIQVQNPQINIANVSLQALCASLGVLYVDTHSLYTDLTVGLTYGNWLTTYATPLTEDGLHPNTNGALLIAQTVVNATLASFGALPSRQVYIGAPNYPNLFDNPTFAKVTTGLATGVAISTDAGTQTVVSSIGVFNNAPSQDFAVTPATFDGSGVSMLHIIFSIPVTGATPVTQLALTDMLQSCADIVIDNGSGGTPVIQSYGVRMRLFYNGGASSVFAFSPLYNDGFDVNRNFLSVVSGRVTTSLFQVPDVSANLTAVQFSIFVGSTTTTPFRLRVSNPCCVKIPAADLALALKSTLTASAPVYTDAKGNLVSNTVQGTGATVQATSPTIAAPTLTGTTNAATLGVTTINSNSANLFMPSQTAAVTQAVAQFLLGGSAATFIRFGGGSTTGTTLSASAAYANCIVGTSIVTTASSGTNPIITSLGIKPPTVTVTGGSTVTTASTLHIDGTPTTGSNPVAISIKGNTSGVIGIATQAAAGTYNYNLPTTAGTAGQAQLSGGGGSAAMTWGNVPLIDAVNTATDANYTVTSAEQLVKLPVITANRTVSIPSAATYVGRVLKIWNQNTSGTFTWSFTGATVKDAASNTLTTVVNSSIYMLESDGTNWVKLN